MTSVHVVHYANGITAFAQFVLVADVGGTNTRCALFEVVNTTYTIVFAMHFLTKEVHSFTDVILQALLVARNDYGILVDCAAIALAGYAINHNDVWKLSNAPLTIIKQELLHQTPLKTIFMLNDFEAIGYGLEVLDEQDFISINTGSDNRSENKVIVGAGTGLGKCIVAWNVFDQHYVPIPSEGGHADFSIHNQEELELALFIRKKRYEDSYLEWEDLLSGRGIANIYRFFEKKERCISGVRRLTIKENDYNPELITSYRDSDDCCRKTFEFFCALYGRCAKNFVLEARAFNGVYLAGGIVMKHAQTFARDFFLAEFLYHRSFKKLLEQVPVSIINNQHVGLFGAARFAMLRVNHMKGL